MTPKVGRTWKSSEPSLYCSNAWLAERRRNKGGGGIDEDLQGVFQLCALGANTNVVQDSVPVFIFELCWVALLLESFADGLEVFIASRCFSLLIEQYTLAHDFFGEKTLHNSCFTFLKMAMDMYKVE